MEYSNALKKFGPGPSAAEVERMLEQIRPLTEKNRNREVYRKCFSCIDLTSLGSTDSHEHIERFVRKAVEFPSHYPDIPNVASVCVYPAFVETAGVAIGESGLAITSVSGGFPSSQTYLEVKMLETSMAVENGADEIDIVIGVGEMLSGEYDPMGNEIETLRKEVGEDVTLKVILETGLLREPALIYRAAVIAMLAGADFIKTSTGKTGTGATPEAAVAMCAAIRSFAEKTGRATGFKAAGGISAPDDAVLYYTIVERLLGQEYLTPERFRLGASSLAGNLLDAITGREERYF